MKNVRNPHWYREEAARLRAVAATISDSAKLRDSYLALSIEYERLAVILEDGIRTTQSSPTPKRSRAPRKRR